VKFQINGGGYLVGQVLIPASTVINLTKPDAELTEFERLARGRPIPLDVTALDYDCALLLWRAHPSRRHLLRRHLSEFDEAMFQRLLLAADEATLRYWPQGVG